MLDDSGRGQHTVLPYDIAELAETPELTAGDLLLMRGDVIHQTQDADTRRVAASIRLVNRETSLSLDTLLGFGLMKWNMMRKNPQVYADMLGAFRRAGTRSLNIEHVLKPLGRLQGRGGLSALCVELSLAKLRSRSAD